MLTDEVVATRHCVAPSSLGLGLGVGIREGVRGGAQDPQMVAAPVKRKKNVRKCNYCNWCWSGEGGLRKLYQVHGLLVRLANRCRVYRFGY
jgi:hypothetical protein